MKSHRITVTMPLDAPPQRVYSILADYRAGHPSILPNPPFMSLHVEQGGFGAGTRFELKMRLLGKLHTYHGIVSEPQPGRVLVEKYSGTDLVTSFLVEPQGAGAGSRVTIATDNRVHSGVLGTFEGWLAAALLRPIYRKELIKLATLVSAHGGSASRSDDHGTF